MRRVLGLALLGGLLIVGALEAHPGRLDATGCHTVRKDFVYKSGKVVRRGEVHCHRLLTGERLRPAIILDGREVLMDSRRDIERDEDTEPKEEGRP